MNRCSFCEWIPILPWPVWPLAGQSLLGQNVVVGSMMVLLALCGSMPRGVYLGPHFRYKCASPRLSAELPVAALGQLTLVKALGFRLKAQGKLRRLHRRPRQIRMAIFDIARAFAPAIADLCAVHTAAIRRRVPHAGKAVDRAGFQRDRLGQYRADALHGEQLL